MKARNENWLEKLNVPLFRPLPLLTGGHAQTIAAVWWPQESDPLPDRSHLIPVPGGDKVVIMENRPLGWKEGDRIALLIHGLSGCYQSNYMSRLARKLSAMGLMAVRMNLRGCGPGFGHAVAPYNAGRSEDAREVLHWLEREHPRSPVTLFGFSLGANISLKMAGEDAGSPTGRLDSLIAVSPPAHLAASARKLSNRRNFVFDQFFVNKLKAEIARMKTHHPHLEWPRLPRYLTLTAFDELYTAPRSGFASAAEYYEQSRSDRLIPEIAVPTLILSSMDDPVVDTECFSALPENPNVDLVLTKKGGHVAFLGRRPADNRWMDEILLGWLRAVPMTGH